MISYVNPISQLYADGYQLKIKFIDDDKLAVQINDSKKDRFVDEERNNKYKCEDSKYPDDEYSKDQRYAIMKAVKIVYCRDIIHKHVMSLKWIKLFCKTPEFDINELIEFYFHIMSLPDDCPELMALIKKHNLPNDVNSIGKFELEAFKKCS